MTTTQQDIDTQATLDYVELAARFGLAQDQAYIVLNWSGEDGAHLWTDAEAEELAGVWAADTERIRLEG
jgi:hypothetical protein